MTGRCDSHGEAVGIEKLNLVLIGARRWQLVCSDCMALIFAPKRAS